MRKSEVGDVKKVVILVDDKGVISVDGGQISVAQCLYISKFLKVVANRIIESNVKDIKYLKGAFTDDRDGTKKSKSKRSECKGLFSEGVD